MAQPSFFSKVGAGLKAAATTVQQKSKEAYDHMKSPPSQVQCDHCVHKIMVPVETFNWLCPNCNKSNVLDNKACSQCTFQRGKLMEPRIQCTMCKEWTQVPFTNAEYDARQAAKATKKAAVGAATWTKEKYHHLKSAPVKFNCKHCNTELVNPNVAPESLEEGKEVKVDESKPPVEEVECTVCKKVTPVPGSNFSASVKQGARKVSSSTTKMYYGLANKPYANCPICATAVTIPQESATALQTDDKERAAAAPNAPPKAPLLVNLTCPKCETEFPTKT